MTPKPLLALMIGAIIAMFASCSGSKKFKVDIDAETLGTQKLTVVYATDDGNRVVLEPTAVDGHVHFTGSASKPAEVEVFTSAGTKLVSFLAANGDEISITFSDGKPTISGARGALTDSVIAAVDTTRFSAPAIIVSRDSSETWDAEGIWIFTSSAAERTKAVMDTIRAHKKQVRDVFISPDFNTWLDAVRYDSATWKHGILPEGPAAIPQITSTPLLLQVDSAGQVIRTEKL